MKNVQSTNEILSVDIIFPQEEDSKRGKTQSPLVDQDSLITIAQDREMRRRFDLDCIKWSDK